MDCMSCKDNYLQKLFHYCLMESNDNKDKALDIFIKKCVEIGDERTSLSILNAMVDGPGSCEKCKQYAAMYNKGSK